MSYDVAIIGAGAAGLAAAVELARGGKTAVVLEARDRIGGRCWSLDVPGLPVPVELGAEFIHGHPEATLDRMREAGIAAVDAPINRLAVVDGRLRPRGDRLHTEVLRLLRREAGTLEKRDVSFASFLARARHRLSAEARTFARMRVQGYDAAFPARASARAIAEEWVAEEAGRPGHFRPRGGYGALLAVLAGSLQGSGVELKLQHAVRSVRWQRGRVDVEGVHQEGPLLPEEGSPRSGGGGGRSFRVNAQRAIVTLPLGVLKQPARASGAVRFDPPLREKHFALKLLESGAVIKVVLLFRAAFWEEIEAGRYRGVSFFHSPRAALPTFWTARPEQAPLVVAWAGGPKAAQFAGSGAAAIVRAAAASFASVFGIREDIEERLAAAWVHHWQRDPLARGAYSYVAVGGHGARRSLAEPLHDTLYFAGEAADHEGEHGTVAGALRSGECAARAVLGRL